MKVFSKIVIAGIVIAGITACGSSKKSDNLTIKPHGIPLMPEIFGADISKELTSANGKEKMESTISYKFYSDPKLPFQDSVNYHIAKFNWELTADQDNPYVYKPLTHEFFYQRLDELEADYKEYQTLTENDFVWQLNTTSDIEKNIQNYVQIKQNAFFYFGGAHPNTIIVNSLIDMKDGKTLLLRDLVTDVKKFNTIAEKHFRKSRELKPDESLKTDFWFEDGIFQCNDNFIVTAEGIIFTFNAYEVAPYYFGATFFTVPLSEVKDLLKIDVKRI